MPFLFVLLIIGSVSFPTWVLAQDTSTQIRGPRGTDRQVSQPQQIGPLTPTDTLWRIAERHRPDGSVSVYQVMYALYLKNPDAFIDGNLNHLRPGATLLLPTLAEVRNVEVARALQKSNADDKAWAERNKTAAAATVPAAPAQTATAETKTAAAPVLPAPATVATAQWQAELEQQKQQQHQELEELRKQFRESILVVDAIAVENNQLRTSLAKLQRELEALKAQLGEDSELHQQVEQLVKQQAEILAQQQAAQLAAQQNADSGSGWQAVAANPLSWILAASLPALIVLTGVLLWVKRRGKKIESAVNAAKTDTAPEPGYQSPLPPLDEHNDVDDNSLFELDDALLEDAFHETTDFNQDETDTNLTALSDQLFEDVMLEDDSLLPADELSAATEDPAEPEDEFDADNILSASDLSELLTSTDDAEEVVELADDEALAETAVRDEAADADDFFEEIELDIPTEQDTGIDTSELDEFAESLVDIDVEDVLLPPEDDDSEAKLSAELAELLEQVEGSSSQVAEPQEFIAGDEDELIDEPLPGVEQSGISPDLTSSEDSSVSQPSEAAMSVENPSKMLDSYPELELTDELLPASAEETDDMPSDELTDLENTQFDELLSELEAMAENLPEDAENGHEPEINFDLSTDIELDDDDFVAIDKLLEASEAVDADDEKFSSFNVNVGLEEFADIIGEADLLDVDAQDNGYAAKLDLVRAYIEIDDQESAELLLDDILGSDAPEHIKDEAKLLKA
ncbi:FimV/HubP family polar landmark protein [Chromatiaceae bacterium AAb-1]|nr:FimV/HubP family polar landmark protein [Chromatiaceae bacterium AAb-1]